MKKFLAIVSVALGFFMALLDTTIVNITLPKMTTYFSTDVKTISWVLSGYNLAFAVLLITASRLADQFGRKKIYLIGIICFTSASVLSGLSSSINMLITFRVIQGAAAAFVVPVTLPMSLNLVSSQKRGALMGFWGAFAGLAAATGPALGGVLSQFLNWQSIFYVNVPLGCTAFLLCLWLIKETYDETAQRSIDWLGMITLSISMFCLTFALIQGNDEGWRSAYILCLFGGSVLSLILFIVIEARTSAPMVPLWILRIVPFSASNLSFLMVGIGLMSGVLLLAFYLTGILGMSELGAGLVIMAMPLAAMPAAAMSGNLSQKFGSRIFIVIGMLVLSLAIFLFSQLTPESTKIDVIWRLVMGGIGVGFTMAPLMGAVVQAVPSDKAGMASGISNMARTLGQVLGAAILISILNTQINVMKDTAKSEAFELVQHDTLLNNTVRNKLISKLNSSSSSSSTTLNNQIPTLSDILVQLDEQETKTIHDLPAKVTHSVHDRFTKQEQEVEKLYPKIQQIFADHVPQAKADAISLVNKDTVLTDGVKSKITSNLQNPNTGGKMLTLSSITASIQNQESGIVDQAQATAIQSVKFKFSIQKKEIIRIYPEIKNTFTNAIADAFSHTFKVGSLIMLLGVVFAAFSDKRRRIANDGDNEIGHNPSATLHMF